METPSQRPARAPRTFELRDSRWVEDAAPERPRAPFWVIVPMTLAALTGVVLVAFAATAALAIGLALRARAGLLRLFGR
jgi:hypothetical protein